MKNRAVFLDRDGTINMDVGYPRDFSQVTIYPSSFEAIRRINEAGFRAVVVTNQSGIGRSFLSEADLAALHQKMTAALAAGGARLDAIYYCPHHDQAVDPRYRMECDCRKPRPGMALRAALAFDLDLAASYMIGDKVEDVRFGLAAGATPILVRTGYGEASAVTLAGLGIRPAAVVSGILEAVDWLLKRERASR